MAVSKKSTTTKSKTSSVKSHTAAHPTWIDMIKECIVAHPEDARTGVSRPTIKKFVENKYSIDVNASTASQLNRAITSGSEKGVFVLPKGPSGKVKLAPKVRPDAAKENATPVVKKPLSKSKAPSTKPGTSKKTLVKAGTTKASAGTKTSTIKAPTVKKYSSAKKSSLSKAVSSDKKLESSKKKVNTTRKPSSTRKSTKKASVAARSRVSKGTTNASSKAKASASKAKPASKMTSKPKSSTKKSSAT